MFFYVETKLVIAAEVLQLDFTINGTSCINCSKIFINQGCQFNSIITLFLFLPRATDNNIVSHTHTHMGFKVEAGLGRVTFKTFNYTVVF